MRYVKGALIGAVVFIALWSFVAWHLPTPDRWDVEARVFLIYFAFCGCVVARFIKDFPA